MATVIILFTITPAQKLTGGFTRTWMPGLTVEAVQDLSVNSYYPAGFIDANLVLANTTAPAHVQISQRGALENAVIQSDSIFSTSKLTVRGKHFILVDLEKAVVHEGFSRDWRVRSSVSYSSQATDILRFGNQRWISRLIDGQRHETVILLQDQFSHDAEVQKHIIEKQVDGIFCSDGMLMVSPDTRTSVYLYYYRNEFIVFDTLLRVIGKHSTIDTISRARVVVRTLSSGSTQLASPPIFVNRKAYLTNHYLYVLSAIASNAPKEQDRNFIDVYQVETGEYLGTQLIPKYAGWKIHHFAVDDNNERLHAIQGNSLVTYRLSQPDP